MKFPTKNYFSNILNLNLIFSSHYLLGGVEYKIPIFRLKNKATDKYLTAEGIDSPIKALDDNPSSDGQKW